MFQEVVDESEVLLRDELKKIYEFCSGDINENPSASGVNINKQSSQMKDYYTMILFRKKNFTLRDKNLIEFKNSGMGRNLLVVKLNYKKKVDICVMTSHLESTAEYSKQRVDQLKRCFKEMLEQDVDDIVFFGGDLNLRDSEVI